MLRNMFHDLELEDDCVVVIDRFPRVLDIVNSKQNFPSKIKMGTKALEKRKKSKAAASQSNCSSMHPLHPIGENGEIMDVEEQMPKLVDTSDNEMQNWLISVIMKSAVQGRIYRGPPLKIKV